ncbi:hypothetical protein EON65_47510 [archaeon]|nr:MAG: hypothetical protein EON65_47510 [archaeon]
MMKTILCVFLYVFSFTVLGQNDYANGPWRKSLDGEGACWTDSSCKRVMTTAHGGEWNVKNPYDSMPAFQRAWEDGADAIKGGKFLF